MIKKVILIVFVMVFIHLNQAKSCDACGCASGNVGFGLISDYRYNFIQLGFFNMGFRSNHENNFTTVDQFRQWRVAMRYGIGKDARFNLNAFIPYITNVRETSIEKQRLSGFGDIRLEISYALFNNVSLGDNSFLYSEIGVGVKLPTGAYNAELHQDNLPDNFNIGNGSLSYKISSSTVLNFGSNGLSFSGNYLINGNTKDGYHFGNQLELALQARHPDRFVPHYAMVTFMRIPYRVALERSEIQRGILERATRGRDSLDGIDWNTLDTEVIACLPPLDTE